MKILVIGGGAGGAGAAARCRRLDESADITVYERSGYASYSNCGLPYKFSKEIENFSQLIMTTPEELLKQYKLKVKIKHEVVAVDAKKKEVTVIDHATNTTFTETYDKLIVSAGAAAFVPPFKGIENTNHVFSLKTPDDVLAVEEFIKTKKPKNVVVVGGGFIGTEIAENFIHSGYNVTLIDASKNLLGLALDQEFSKWIHKSMRDNGVKLLLDTKMQAFEGNDILLEDGTIIPADIVFMTVGVKVENKMYADAGIKIGVTGGIVVDNKQQTSDKDVYAVGDLAEITNKDGKPSRTTLAFNASRQAVVAANNINGYKNHLGNADVFNGVTGASTLSMFDITTASVGKTETQLKAEGIKYNKTLNARGANISAVKGGGNVFLKVLYDDEFNILGAQAAGPQQAEKRISYISLAMLGGIKYDKFQDFMVAYSPKTDTTYDATTMGSRVAIHQADGSLESVFSDELIEMQKDGWTLVDVREDYEHVGGILPGALKLPLSRLRESLDELPKDGKYILNCKTGGRSYNATLVLKANGYKNVKNLAGGYAFNSIALDVSK